MSSVDVLPVPSYKATSAPVCIAVTYHGAQAGSRQTKTSKYLIEFSAAADEDNKVDEDRDRSESDR